MKTTLSLLAIMSVVTSFALILRAKGQRQVAFGLLLLGLGCGLVIATSVVR